MSLAAVLPTCASPTSSPQRAAGPHACVYACIDLATVFPTHRCLIPVSRSALLGRMRCLAALAEWQALSELCRSEWQKSEPHMRCGGAAIALLCCLFGVVMQACNCAVGCCAAGL